MNHLEEKQERLVTNGLITADRYVNRNYLIGLSDRNVLPLDEREKNTGAVRLFQIERIVFDRKENVNDKLISVYSALQNIGSTVLMLIRGTGNEIRFYLGVRSEADAATAGKILEKSFMGNFPGSVLRSLRNSEISGIMKDVIPENEGGISPNVSCVTVVPSMRDENKEKFVQGVEKFIDTMQGLDFTVEIISRPVSKEELEQRKRGYEDLYSSLSPFVKISLAYGENNSEAVSEGIVTNFSRSVNNSISSATGSNVGVSNSSSQGRSRGRNTGFGGFGTSTGKSETTTRGYSSGQSWSRTSTEGVSESYGEGSSRGVSKTTGDSRTTTVEYRNKTVENLLEKIDGQMKRIKACESFGVWECAAYFVADDIQTSVIAANAYKALMLGEDTNVENSFVNVWNANIEEDTENILEYIRYGMHPLMIIDPEEGYEAQSVTPGNYVSGKELPMLMGIPHRSVTGITVNSIAEFGRNVFLQNGRKPCRMVDIGKVRHMGRTEDTGVGLDLGSFSSHCFVTGSTGSGKSNAVYCLLDKLIKNDVPFMVIEPAKGEYKSVFGGLEGINVFTVNPAIAQMLKLNPFRFDERIHILEHLDRLVEIFNACWEMYAAMPAILKEAIEACYIDKGWDLANSVYLKGKDPVYPTFRDLTRTLEKVILDSGYSEDTKGDYTGALVTRVTSLTNGISGQIFCDNYDIPDEILFDSNVVIDLSRVGSSETKALIMGIIVLKLTEYRMVCADGANRGLRHVTVMEEAHNLLRKVRPQQTGNDLLGKSVEMICASIAEMRTYGEGFIIVDQSPTSVDEAAIKNTNTKILMRLPDKEDCQIAGNAAALEEAQQKELAKLSTGTAVVMQNDWLEPVLVKVDLFSGGYEQRYEPVSYKDIRLLRGAVLVELMRQYIIERNMDMSGMLQTIECVDVATDKKREMIRCMSSVIERLKKGRDIDFFCETLLNISGSRDLFRVMEKKIRSEGGNAYDDKNITAWKNELTEAMDKYIDMQPEFVDTLIKYLIYAKQIESETVDYIEVYKSLYGKNV